MTEPAPPTSAEEAAKRQLQLYNEGTFRRDGSMHPDYEMRQNLDHGMGMFPVNIHTGEVCDCKMVWYEDGKVLLCPNCWLEGT